MDLIVTPEDGLTPLIVAIKKATKQIEITIFRFDLKELQKALETAVTRGVKVHALIAHTTGGGAKRLRKLELDLLAAGVTAGLLAAQVTPDLAGLLAVVAAAGLGWRLRFRPSADTRAWRRGAAGERRTARLLAPLERRGWAVLHDLAIPGSPANIDHLVLGPGGVLVVDSKQYWGRLRLDRDGMVWHGRHLLVSTLRTVRWQADQADEVLGVADVQVPAVVAVYGASVPGGLLQADGVTIAPARRVPDLLQALPPILGPERVAWLADRARLRFHPAA